MFAEMIMASSNFCAFTGAGISTACGIPDYRSGFNTVMESGPGGWETAANKEKYVKMMKEQEKKKLPQDKKSMRTSIQKAYPSFTHRALYELVERDRLKFIISQNVDGLHRKSRPIIIMGTFLTPVQLLAPICSLFSVVLTLDNQVWEVFCRGKVVERGRR